MLGKVKIEYGKLLLLSSEKKDLYSINARCKGDNYAIYVAAFLRKTKEGVDMETVGDRPWNIEDVSVEEFMNFALSCMNMIKLLSSD